MAKVILLNKTPENTATRPALQVYTLAAWQLAFAALWPFEKVKPAAIKRSQDFIKGYLSKPSDTKAAFVSFCEQILLYSRILSASPSLPIDPPAIWLNPAHKAGFPATNSLCRLMQTSHTVRPDYLEGIAVLAEGFCQYLNHPTPAILTRLHTKLSRLKQYSLLRLLSHIVLQQSLSTKQRV